MLEEMPANAIKEWWDYYQIEPWGPERYDLQSGIIASTLANVNRDSKKTPEPFKPSDFMPEFDKPRKKPEISAKERAAALTHFFSSRGRQVDIIKTG